MKLCSITLPGTRRLLISGPRCFFWTRRIWSVPMQCRTAQTCFCHVSQAARASRAFDTGRGQSSTHHVLTPGLVASSCVNRRGADRRGGGGDEVYQSRMQSKSRTTRYKACATHRDGDQSCFACFCALLLLRVMFSLCNPLHHVHNSLLTNHLIDSSTTTYRLTYFRHLSSQTSSATSAPSSSLTILSDRLLPHLRRQKKP